MICTELLHKTEEYGERKMSVIFPVFLKIRIIAGLLTAFLGKTGGIQAIFIRHIPRAKVSDYTKKFVQMITATVIIDKTAIPKTKQFLQILPNAAMIFLLVRLCKLLIIYMT